MNLLYGATGYTGRLVAREAARAGLELVLAGRRPPADPHGFDVRLGGLDDIDLTGVTAVLNCAATAGPLVTRCVAAGVHYLDLAGEVPAHRAARAAADGARVTVLPGAGYGIVPSDCLAAHVARRVERPRRVEIALRTVGGVSRGTAETVLGGLREPGVVRRGGALVPARPGEARRRVDFGDGPVVVVRNPWRADLLASVPGVADLEAFQAFPAPVRALMRVPHGGLLRAVARRLPEGPDDDALATGRSAVWARAVGADGTTAEATLHGPDAYVLTARAAVACLQRIGEAPPGHQTPASAFGADFVLGLEGVRRS